MSDRTEWTIWNGPEVEGRLSGIHTLFFGNNVDLNLAFEAIHKGQHLFFNSLFIKQHGFTFPLAYVNENYITLEIPVGMVNSIPGELRQKAHLMICIDVPELEGFDLKPDDTIRLTLKDYHTLSATRHNFTLSVPADYDNDEPAGR